jgi:hypothetical protein
MVKDLYRIVCLVGCAFLLMACGSNQPAQIALGQTQQAVIGGMAIPTTSIESETTASTPARYLDVGDVITPVGEQPLHLYALAEASAPVLASYSAGSVLTIVEPTGVYRRYPVLVEGRMWYRMQASDGLVGWALIDGVQVSSQGASNDTP